MARTAAPPIWDTAVGQFVGDGPRIERQSGDVGNAAQARRQLRFQIELQQAEHLISSSSKDFTSGVTGFAGVISRAAPSAG